MESFLTEKYHKYLSNKTMQTIFFDAPLQWKNLLPLTFTRPISHCRVGILTIVEKWQQHLKVASSQTFYLTTPYLHSKYPISQDNSHTKLYINGGLCPDTQTLEAIKNMPNESAIWHQFQLLALKTTQYFGAVEDLLAVSNTPQFQQLAYPHKITLIQYPYDIFTENRQEIIRDFQLVTHNRKSQPIADKHTIVYGSENIFVEEGASIKAAILNAEEAPIYIGKNAKVHEGAIIKGAFALGEGAEVNMGAKIKGDSTVGLYSKVGGEISNSVIFGYSNKGHDGFLGNSVIGEWCNLGADTNTSNLKNNYGEVKIWNYAEQKMLGTGKQFCGTLMGDHAKCSINTMLNTGTVVGVGANLFGAAFPPKYVPSFAWGGAENFDKFDFASFCSMVERVMQRRNLSLTVVEKDILQHIYQQ
jgi:UDP-N-acetylglucosamine diphosphorylase/glucosamine-1-phosphate N-acetyltransferase